MAPAIEVDRVERDGIYRRRGPGGVVGVVVVRGVIGGDCDILDVEEAVSAAAIEEGPLVIDISSPGGAVGDAEYLGEVVARVRATGRMVAAFIRQACGAAYVLGSACSPLIIDPRGCVGHFHVKGPEIVQRVTWDKITARRRRLCSQTIERYAAGVMNAEAAELHWAVDGIATLTAFVNGRCGR